MVGATQLPSPEHFPAAEYVFPEHDAEEGGQLCPVPAYEHVSLLPSHFPPQVASDGFVQPVRPATGWPLVSRVQTPALPVRLHALHCSEQAVAQQTPSAQMPLAHFDAWAAVQFVPSGLPAQVPVSGSQYGVLPLQVPQHSEIAMQSPLQGFLLPEQVKDVPPAPVPPLPVPPLPVPPLPVPPLPVPPLPVPPLPVPPLPVPPLPVPPLPMPPLPVVPVPVVPPEVWVPPAPVIPPVPVVPPGEVIPPEAMVPPGPVTPAVPVIPPAPPPPPPAPPVRGESVPPSRSAPPAPPAPRTSIAPPAPAPPPAPPAPTSDNPVEPPPDDTSGRGPSPGAPPPDAPSAGLPALPPAGTTPLQVLPSVDAQHSPAGPQMNP